MIVLSDNAFSQYILIVVIAVLCVCIKVQLCWCGLWLLESWV